MTDTLHLVYVFHMNCTAQGLSDMNERLTDTGRRLALVVCNANPQPVCVTPARGVLVCIECGRAFASSQAPVDGRCPCRGELQGVGS